MVLNALKCNYLTPPGLKGLKIVKIVQNGIKKRYQLTVGWPLDRTPDLQELPL